MQIAVQSKIKLFYRPEAILPERGAIWQDQVLITKQGKALKVNNPTPYYITYVGLGHPQGKERTTIKGFSAFMVAPSQSRRSPSRKPWAMNL